MLNLLRRSKVKRSFSASAFFKPESRKKQKAREDRQWDKDRAACRLKVWTDAGGKCERCGRPLKLNPNDEGATEFNTANINEKVPRSLGGDPLDPKNCNCLCAGCHTGRGFHDH